MAQRREERTAREAEVRALEGVEKAQPKKKKGTGVTRSRVTKSAQGIKVSMPSKKKSPQIKPSFSRRGMIFLGRGLKNHPSTKTTLAMLNWCLAPVGAWRCYALTSTV